MTVQSEKELQISMMLCYFVWMDAFEYSFDNRLLRSQVI